MNKESMPDSAINFGAHVSLLLPGAVLQNRYRVVRQLGTGGMGAVYEAIDQRLEATVALKETFSADDRLRRQFEQEARLLAQLHHPALPRVSDYFTEGDRAFLVMQFIAGADLAEIIVQQPGPFPAHQVIAWADQLLDALIYLHTRDRKIIHRDIKPHNLKLNSNGQIALLDFGLAKAHAGDVSGASSSNSIFGYTRRYSPLEQIQDQGTTPQSDIYALGATLYHLLTGTKPADSLARAAALANSQTDPLEPANQIHRAVGSEIAAILNRAMALNARDRYDSATEFREALRKVGRELGDGLDLSSTRRGAVNDVAVTAIVAGHSAAGKIDPFDSYSILKPDENIFQVSKARRGPGAIAATLTIILIAMCAVIYDPGRVIDSTASLLNSAKATATRESAGETAAPQKRLDPPPVRTSGIRNVTTSSTGEVGRRNDQQKRRSVRPDNSKLRSLKPPPFSIAP